MVSIKTVESLAEAGMAAGSKALPSKLAEVAETLAGKAGLSVNKASLEARNKIGSGADLSGAGKELLAPLQITDTAAGASAVWTPGQRAISKANEALVAHVTDRLPQIQNGKLDWILGGSAATNALANARTVKILDASRLPAIVPARTIELSNEARAAYGGFLRKVGDVDAFVVKNGKNKFLDSPALGTMEIRLPAAANDALTSVGEARASRLMQAVKMDFDHPEVAAIEYAGKTVFLTGPGQLVGNKMRQILMSYAPADAVKTTGDFSHLLNAAGSIYTEKELLQFGRQALQRNDLLYKREITLPWDRSENNANFLAFLRKVLESEERNGAYLRTMKVQSTDTISAMRLLEKHPLAKDKQALSEFVNRHAERIAKMDTPGTLERSTFLAQGGSGKANLKFFSFLETIPARSAGKEGPALSTRLQKIDESLGLEFNLPAVLKQNRGS